MMTKFKYSKASEKAQKKFGTFGKKYLVTKIRKTLYKSEIEKIKKMDNFFISSTNKSGSDPNVSVKYLKKSIIKITNKSLIIKNWKGDGKLITIGNILENPNVGLLFFDLKKKLRLRVKAKAKVLKYKKKKKGFKLYDPDSKIIFEFKQIWNNCLRYK